LKLRMKLLMFTASIAALFLIASASAEFSAEVTATPSLPSFSPGDTITSLTVMLADASGTPITGATVTGTFGPQDNKLVFSHIGGGQYLASLNYRIALDDPHLLAAKLSITAGGEDLEKSAYFLTATEERFLLIVDNPPDTEVAPGQNVAFEAHVKAIPPNGELANTQIFFIDEAGVMLPMGDAMNVVIGPGTEPSRFIVYANATVDGKIKDAVQKIELRKKQVLGIGFNKSMQDVETGLMALVITYVDTFGEPFSYAELKANITGYPSQTARTVTLYGQGGVFTFNYGRVEGDTSAELEVWDSYGNVGKASLPQEFFSTDAAFEIPLHYLAISFVLVLMAFIGFAVVKKKRSKNNLAKEERTHLKKESEELEAVIKQTKLDFYKHKVEPDAANKRITEAEEKLKMVKKQMEELAN